MADASWLDLFGAALGGGFTVKLLDIGYQEIRQRSDRKRQAKQFVEYSKLAKSDDPDRLAPPA